MQVLRSKENNMQILNKKVILSTDFSDTSKEASFYAPKDPKEASFYTLKLAPSNKARLPKALHEFDTSTWNASPSYYMYMKPTKPKLESIIEDYEKIPQREKNALKALAKSFGIEIDTSFIQGSAGKKVVHFADEFNADLLVLGTHGYKE